MMNALIILLFYYTSLRQVYELDDNTLTLPGADSRSQSFECTNRELRFIAVA